MIEFSGHLSGPARKRFFARSVSLAQNVMLFAVLAVLPTVIRLSMQIGSWQMLAGYCTLFVAVPLLARIPKSKKEQQAIIPKRIYIDDACIICVADKYVESRLISDVKKIFDYPEFYELVFPFGRVSEKYICQKDLLTQGTLEEFENLFPGKIIQKNSGRTKSL